MGRVKRKKFHFDETGHKGEIILDQFCQSKCKCGFHSDPQPYPYLAIEPLIQHFKDSKTLIEDRNSEQGFINAI